MESGQKPDFEFIPSSKDQVGITKMALSFWDNTRFPSFFAMSDHSAEASPDILWACSDPEAI
jgi:hypothetical protein